ncbi:Pol4p [Sugiyamaella lignohabitans]|uniref:DNA polymerase n=1 Tax=Sugiyamaella lignohabitans TaxID=796027 RepID=A0A167E5M8_9ASCO|nr:Pol4p [Sugiyamaella lignohabitans]ANB13671.1 Pol4p [Sugiyamaella lignohabitans]
MVPSRPSSKLYQIKSKKYDEYGARVTSSFDKSVSHVLIDPEWDGSRTLKYLHISAGDIRPEIDKGTIHFVRDSWPSACIENKQLIPESPDYTVQLYSPAPSPETTPEPEVSQKLVQTVISPEKPPKLKKRDISTSSNTSLSPEPDTPKQTAIDDLNPVEASGANTSIENKAEKKAQDGSGNDELDSVIQEAELQEHAARFLSDDEIEHALQTQRKKYSAPYSRPKRTSDGRVLKGNWDTFLCMKAGEDNIAKPDGPNALVINILSLMLHHYEAEGDQWRTLAYRKAIATLKKQTVPVRTAAQAVKLPGIGSRLADKIEEINKTGDLKRLKYTQGEGKFEVLELLKRIYGVGNKTANKWYSEGIRTLDDVRERKDLTANQQTSLDHYEDFAERIPRDNVTKHFERVRDAVHEIDPEIEATAMGSYRRLQPDCGDIDIILTKRNASRHDLTVTLAKLLDVLFEQGFAKYTFGGIEANSMRWLGASAHPDDGNKWRRMDILLVPWEERGAAFIYYTGNDIFNRSMRLLAQKKGYRLNEKGLFLAPHDRKSAGAVGPLVCGEDEEKIFETLGVPNRPPHKRIIG